MDYAKIMGPRSAQIGAALGIGGRIGWDSGPQKISGAGNRTRVSYPAQAATAAMDVWTFYGPIVHQLEWDDPANSNFSTSNVAQFRSPSPYTRSDVIHIGPRGMLRGIRSTKADNDN
jgi:hypothetical protein